jgi:hypothetical protein
MFGGKRDWLNDLDVGDTIMWEDPHYPDWLEPRLIEGKKSGPHGTYWKVAKRPHWVDENKMCRRGHPTINED